MRFSILFAVFSAGMLTGSLVTIYEFLAETPAELQREYDAMRICMQTAGKTRCQMTIDDFIRYYELQAELEIPLDQ